jgi:cellulose synthase/poly-beta-1,6-N-acetylglucosamine synthase-like glycosyltransferase
MKTATSVENWPRISVIVPSYNQGMFIRQTLIRLSHRID